MLPLFTYIPSATKYANREAHESHMPRRSCRIRAAVAAASDGVRRGEFYENVGPEHYRRVGAPSIGRCVPLAKPDPPTFEDISGLLRDVLQSLDAASLGRYVEMLEVEVGKYAGTHVVAVATQVMGLLFMLQAFGVKAGQRVIVPTLASAAAAQAIRQSGAVPTFSEIGDDLTLSPTDLELPLARHDDVTAVVPVHAHGVPCNVDRIQEAVDRAARRRARSIAVVYDAADGIGGVEAFSPSPPNAFGGLNGGIVASQHIGHIRCIKKMRNYGLERSGHAYWTGLDGKVSELHAVVGLASLRRLPDLMAERQRKAHAYADRIERTTSFRLTARLPSTTTQPFKNFTIVVPPNPTV